MNSDTEKVEKENQDKAYVDEVPRLCFDAFLKIYDPETQETFVEQRD